MKPGKKMLAVILLLIAASVLVAIFGMGDDIKGIREMRYGIDIRGGVEAIFEADGVTEKPTSQELETAREVLEMRLDAANITDREVTVDQEGGYIIVRFPWKSDESSFKPEDAIAELGEMAKLTFRDPEGNVLVDGKNVTGSTVEKDKTVTGSGYVVALNFDEEGAKKFEEATESLLGQRMGIYMDEEQISNPMVETKISGGKAVISGMESYDAAKTLSDKINAGALPFSLKTTSFSTISPTMGNSALEVMIAAGCLAFLVVCLFMFFYYKLPGAVACLTLLLQMTLQLLAVSVPQYTLTLPGIAGIILSLGMAVDANIIIAERISEDLQKGYSVRTSIRNGYKNGFTSVLDGNITTAVVAVILMIFGSGSMLSFGYTLLVGMVVNMIAGVSISMQILLSLSLYKRWNNEKWFRKKKELRIRQFFKKKWICVLISGGIFLTGMIGCAVKGVTLDTQFTGGVVLSYTVHGATDLTAIEAEVGQVTDRAITVQETESNVSEERKLQITLAGNGGISPEEQKEITAALERAEGEQQITLAETYAVEPYIGERALKNAAIAIGLSFLFIVIYVAFRFSTLSGFAAGVTALIALFHDVFVVFFAFVLAGIPLNDAFVAVVLTIIGYSINDTIVVYDRIRENKKDCPKMDIIELNDLSVSQIFARSVNSSLTTTMCVFIILVASMVFQITSIWAFALPMLFGLISGCYSSICIASLLWAMWKKRNSSDSL
ncbi:MAG: SecD/SecF family protein translocase subunit [Roseburia sp.]|nr:SecD/SecF family protein translocase subunit [Roseburia sp.]